MKKNLSYEVSPLCKSVLTHAENIWILTDTIFKLLTGAGTELSDFSLVCRVFPPSIHWSPFL